jgi:hypothetical protein
VKGAPTLASQNFRENFLRGNSTQIVGFRPTFSYIPPNANQDDVVYGFVRQEDPVSRTHTKAAAWAYSRKEEEVLLRWLAWLQPPTR